jgi:cytochrome c biogenesis factor
MLAERLEGWLRREAMLGGAVLLCVALLTVAFAGTLVPPI